MGNQVPFIRPARIEDYLEIAQTMTDVERHELEALVGSRQDKEALFTFLFNVSTLSWAAFLDGELVSVFGVSPTSILCGVGCPWLFGTESLRRHPVTFLRKNKKYIGLMLEQYQVLENHVHEANTVSIHWLEWMGFEVHPAEPWGVSREKFHRFTMETESCASLQHQQ